MFQNFRCKFERGPLIKQGFALKLHTHATNRIYQVLLVRIIFKCHKTQEYSIPAGTYNVQSYLLTSVSIHYIHDTSANANPGWRQSYWTKQIRRERH